jgi:preprotein translocase subunit SecF
MIPITHNRNIFFAISGILVAASIFALIFWGLKLGIEFTGGSLLQAEFKTERLSNDTIKEKVSL